MCHRSAIALLLCVPLGLGAQPADSFGLRSRQGSLEQAGQMVRSLVRDTLEAQL